MNKSMTELIGSDDPTPCRVENPAGTTPLLLVCDHASNYIPAHLEGLGLKREQLHEHIAWDIGAADLTLQLAMRLNCPAVLSNYSRLLIDVNRDPYINDPSSIPEQSDGHTVPGNHQLCSTAKQQRIEQLFQPYHNEVRGQLNKLKQVVDAPALFSIHTFTPSLKSHGKTRPWHAGILWDRDPRLAVPMIDQLRQQQDLVIGDNEPYSGRDIAYTADLHGHRNGFPHCAIEIRQDLLQRYEDTQVWADRLETVFRSLLAQADLHSVRIYD